MLVSLFLLFSLSVSPLVVKGERIISNDYGTRITVVTNSVTSTKNLGRVMSDNIILTY
ncbi:MAG: hypothetical protein K2J85_03750 [Anaeroplasmataceae bacterium]|nr:hypothetical protein [Anaeroplasmataceae bacterium]